MSVITITALALTLAQTPAYNVASIKRTTSTDNITDFQMRPGGSLVVMGMSVRDLIRRAYGTAAIQTSRQVIAGPAWLSDRYGLRGSPFGSLSGQGLTIGELAAVLSADRSIARLVVDKMGLTDRFDFRLQFVPLFLPGPASDVDLVPHPAADSGASIFTAIQELGLRLQSEKDRVECLVIDSIERPTEN